MAGRFLIRGMLCGLAAGLLIFLYARIFGEPSVDGAIAVEDAIAKAAGEAPEPEMVSRGIQASWGLLTGTVVFGLAMGGLFSLVSAFALGRMGRLSARASSALLAGGAFVAVYLVPFLKYPANPPSVGNSDTIGYRTALYFGMIVVSVIAMVAALNLGRSLSRRLGHWHAALAGGLAYVVIVAVASAVLPSIDEVPSAFPASLLWQFRLSAVALQVLLWTSLGLLFGELTARSLARQSVPRGGAVKRT